MKKISTLKRFSLVIACSMLAIGANAQLLVNGPFYNSPGTGAGGTDESWLFDVSLAMTNYGYGASSTTFYRVADDFVVPVGQTWNIDSVYLYCYQTNAPTTSSPITAVNIRVLNDNGGAPGSTVIWGDTTTNLLGRSVWTNGYRVLESATGTSTIRGIFQNVCTTSGLTLPAGTYWLDWQYTGNAAYSGPWANPITITGNATTGNAMKVMGAQNVYSAITDPGSNTPQGFPFSIFGLLTGVESLEMIKNISVYPNPTTDFVNVQIDLTTEMPIGLEILNALGEVVYSSNNGQQTQFNQQIDCSGIASGLYFMKVRVGDGFVIQKFTKE